MGTYDTRRVMLDAGLTALALRGLHDRKGHYPFIDPFATRRARTAKPRRESRALGDLLARGWLALRACLPGRWRTSPTAVFASVEVGPATPP
jgi:hypothetical protein